MTPEQDAFNRYRRQYQEWLRLREGLTPQEQEQNDLAQLADQQQRQMGATIQIKLPERYRWQDADEPIISALDAKDLNEWFQR